MSSTRYRQRLDAIEARAHTPIERARRLEAQHIPPAQWPDAELQAYCAVYCADLQHLSTTQLEALMIAGADDEII